MSGLDDKLREIAHNLWINAELFQHRVDKIHAVDMRTPDRHKDQAIAQIKQAFADEGWSQPVTATEMMALVDADEWQKKTLEHKLSEKGYMTGQEWYDRLVKTVDHKQVSWPNNASNEYIVAAVGNLYLAAAKKAAYIREER